MKALASGDGRTASDEGLIVGVCVGVCVIPAYGLRRGFSYSDKSMASRFLLYGVFMDGV